MNKEKSSSILIWVLAAIAAIIILLFLTSRRSEAEPPPALTPPVIPPPVIPPPVIPPPGGEPYPGLPTGQDLGSEYIVLMWPGKPGPVISLHYTNQKLGILPLAYMYSGIPFGTIPTILQDFLDYAYISASQYTDGMQQYHNIGGG